MIDPALTDLLQLMLKIFEVLLAPAVAWLWWRGRQKTARIYQLELAKSDHEKTYALLQKDVEQLEAVLEKEMDRVDEALKAVPGAGAMHDLALAIEALKGEIKAMGERLCGVDRIVEKIDGVVLRQEEYLINKDS